MTVSGFTILRGVVDLGYPFEASIRSLLPLVDELIVNVGDVDDGTWEAVSAIGDTRLKPFRSTWSTPTPGGTELASQTNLTMGRCGGEWGIYLQADEVLHEEDTARIRFAIERHRQSPVEGLVFRYHHLWRHPAIEADDWPLFYPMAVRAVRLGCGVVSAGDAAGFMHVAGGRTRGLIKAHAGARVFHYGWCNVPERQAVKHAGLRRWYPELTPADIRPDNVFGRVAVRRLRDTHPAVMRGRFSAFGSPPPVTPSLLPAWVRAGFAAIRAPGEVRHWIRPVLPLTLTNTWWKAQAGLRRGRSRRT